MQESRRRSRTNNNMRSNIVTEAGLPTRMGQWWESIPLLTSAVVVVCGVIYLVCLLVGCDSFAEVCFLPSAVISHFQVYRIYTSVLFHGSLLHVLFNMLALVPLGSELERIMGSVRLLYMIILLATSNAIFHLLIALLVAYNPFHPSKYLINECGIGFSGILFSMIVIETSLSGVQSRSVFGLFNVPAKWYAWILLVVFQLLMTNVSLLGHLSGILSGFAYTYGLFNILMLGTSFFSAIESASWLAFACKRCIPYANCFQHPIQGDTLEFPSDKSTCVRRPKFILCTGGNTSGYIPTHSPSGQSPTSSALLSENFLRNFSSWMPLPQREPSPQSTQDDSRFPGGARTLGSGLSQTASDGSADLSLQARLLEDSNTMDLRSQSETNAGGQVIFDGRLPSVDSTAAALTRVQSHQGSAPSDEDIQKLVAMGFERTQVEVALAAADGDLNVAVEILMSQQG